MKTLYKITFLFALVLSLSGFIFAQTGREQGIELYKQGKNKEAVAVLEKTSKQKETRTDAEVWDYLGLAYIKANDFKKAVKAFEKAVDFNGQSSTYQSHLAYVHLLTNKLNKARDESTKAINLDSQNADAYYIRGSASNLETKYDEAINDADKAIGVNPDYSLAYILKSDALLSSLFKNGSKSADRLNLLEQSKNVLETCLKICRNNANTQIQQERLEAVNAFYDYYSKRKDTDSDAPFVPPTPDPNITPLVITAKPRAAYTDKARASGVSGTVSLMILFSSSGQVTHILIAQDLGYGLTENAVRAARQIKFEPAKENGKPISQVKMVQYTFTLY
jgi:TonB family protein